uniref:Putative secreted protein n=1 Tax=Anopheles triannulatus TaxID=58253 RepID=A0A2M4B123_9DIPT
MEFSMLLAAFFASVVSYFLSTVDGAAAFRGCQDGQSCVQIALCGQYLHYVNEPPKNWPPSVRREALIRLCDTQKSVNGSKVSIWPFQGNDSCDSLQVPLNFRFTIYAVNERRSRAVCLEYS